MHHRTLDRPKSSPPNKSDKSDKSDAIEDAVNGVSEDVANDVDDNGAPPEKVLKIFIIESLK